MPATLSVGLFAAIVTTMLALPHDAPPAIPTMTLEQALAYARGREPRIRSALAQLAARREEAKVPRSRWLPRPGAAAELVVGTTNNTTASYSAVAGVDLPRIGATPTTTTTSWSPSPSSLVAVSIGQSIYDFGKIAAETAMMDAVASVADASVEGTGLEVAVDIEEAYYAVLAAREVERGTEEAYARALAHRDLARTAVETGLRPRIDLTRADAEIAQLELRRVRAHGGLREARAVLAASIGSDAREVDAAPRDVDDADAVDAPESGVGEHPAITAARARVRAHRAERRWLRRQLTPNVYASATLSARAGGARPSNGGSPTGDGWLPAIGNWHVGLVLQWSFDPTLVSRGRAADARTRAAEAELELVRSELGLAVERASVELDAARDALPAAEQALTTARENWAQADARFRAGLGTAVELADAEAVLNSAEIDRAIARFGLARARAELVRARGRATTGARRR
jgi:outer membrane protein TolC